MFALIALLQAQSTWFQPQTIPPPAEVVRRVVTCGVPAAVVTASVDRPSGKDIIQVGAGVRADDTIFTCVADASLATLTNVYFFDTQLMQSYMATYASREQVFSHEAGRVALKRHNLLNKLSSYDPATVSLGDYARSLEALCGIEPGRYLKVESPSLITLLPETMKAALAGHGISEDQSWCIMYAISASNLADHRIFFGFVGNEQQGRTDK